MFINPITDSTIRLCRKGSNCCPEITESEEGFIITDDFNGKVKLTKEQFKMLKQAVDHFSKDEALKN